MNRPIIVRGSSLQEYPSLLKLLEIVNMAPEEYFLARYLNDPYANPALSRVVEYDGQLVSHIRIFKRPTNGSMQPMYMGAIANVGTLEEHRKKGYCRALLEDGIKLMKEQGYDFSTVLSGVGVYARCGWEEIVVPRFMLNLKEVDVPLPEGYRIRRFQRDTDLEQVSDIYNEFNYLRPLCVDRTRNYWQKHLNWVEENSNMFLVVEKGQELVAYMRGVGSAPQAEVIEMGHRKGFEEAYLLFIDAMARYRNKYKWERILCNLPSDHEFLKVAACYFEVKQTLKGGLLVKLINLNQILRKLEYTLQCNLNSFDGLKNAKIKFICDGQQACLEIANGVISIREQLKEDVEVRLNQEEFFSLIFHYKTFSELHSQNGISNEYKALLDCLFSGKKAVYWGPDGV